MRNFFLPFSKPTIDSKMIKEVVDTLKSGWITSGPKVEQFEYSFSKYIKQKKVISLTSATAALHLVLKFLDLQEGDEVITPSMTWTSAVNMIELNGGTPVFVDIDPSTLNISIKDLKKKITSKTKVIIPVHIGGHPCDLEQIYKIAKKNKLRVIEDSAHAFGSFYHKKK